MSEAERLESARIRAAFPFLAECVYLNTAGAGLSWAGQGRAAAAFYDGAKARGLLGLDAWRAEAGAARARLARLLGVREDEIRFVATTTEGLNLTANAVRWRVGDEIVLAADEFPSVVLAWEGSAREGAVVRPIVVPSEAEREEALLDALVPSTRVLAVSHVHWITGTRVDLARLGAACRANRTLLVVDGVQALGAVPVDLGMVDVYCAAVFKWLLSGFGLAVMVVRDRAREFLTPLFRGYNNPPPDAELQVSHVNYPGLYALGATLGHLETAVGWPRVFARVDALAGGLAAALAERGYTVAAPASARAGIVSVAARDPAAVRAALAERGVYVEGRGGWVRASPHFYNTPDDVAAFVDALSAVLPAGAAMRGRAPAG